MIVAFAGSVLAELNVKVCAGKSESVAVLVINSVTPGFTVVLETAAIIGGVLPWPTKVTTLIAGRVNVNEELVTAMAVCGDNESDAEVIHGVTEAAVKWTMLKVWIMSVAALVLIATIANAVELVSL